MVYPLQDKLHISGMDDRAAALSRQWRTGCEVIAFCYAPLLDDPSTLPRIQRETEGFARLWLHGPFAELTPCAIDPLVRDVAFRRFRQTVQAARQLNIRRVVFHGGFIPHVYYPDPRLGLCLDVGHANTCVSTTPPAAWVAPMAPYLRHVHLHSNEGDTDLHGALGTGTVPMGDVIDAVLRAAPQATFTIENQNALPSLQWLARQGYIEGAL